MFYLDYHFAWAGIYISNILHNTSIEIQVSLLSIYTCKLLLHRGIIYWIVFTWSSLQTTCPELPFPWHDLSDRNRTAGWIAAPIPFPSADYMRAANVLFSAPSLKFLSDWLAIIIIDGGWRCVPRYVGQPWTNTTILLGSDWVIGRYKYARLYSFIIQLFLWSFEVCNLPKSLEIVPLH